MSEGQYDKFFGDPEAIDWARSVIQCQIERYRKMAEGRDTDFAKFAAKHADYMEKDLLGLGGCVIAGFDERMPRHVQNMQGVER